MAVREIPDDQWAEITRAIAGLQAKSGNSSMSQSGSGLARLVGDLSAFDTKANGLAARLEAAMGRFDTAMATTEQIVTNVEAGASALETINAKYSNGTAPTTGS